MNTGVLVLNSDYSPINVTSFKRGFNLVFKGKAEVVKSQGQPIITSLGNFTRPIIIRLFEYVAYRINKISVSKHRILKRDKFKCVYCGSQRDLTIDHVIPKSKGGKNTWSNMVTSCGKCNHKKGDRTPEEAGFNSVQPKEPTMFSEIINNDLLIAWENFKSGFG
jgi:CRISPR/Cas system Type II protein with McrA/HNH and RuvC-like nuclease domain